MSDKTRPEPDERRIDTRLVHPPYDPMSMHGFVNPPIVRGSTVLFESTAAMLGRKDLKYSYGLAGTPTTTVLEDQLNELEGSFGTALVPSGLAAVTLPLLAFASAGDHVLIVDSVYAPTRSFCRQVLERMNVTVEYYDPYVGAGIADLMRPETSIVFLEAPGSNTFEIQDVRAICDAAHKGGAVTMLDNTWATPVFFRPLDHGVDLSIHALTKYPGGHSDLLMGSVSASERTWGELLKTQTALGINATPDDISLVLRGLKTMGIRLRHHEKVALDLAGWLETRSDVLSVLHPALPSFKDHAAFKRQFTGSTGLFSLVLDCEPAGANRFLDALRIFGLGYSWGGHESLAVSVDLSDRTIAKGPGQGALIRLQIGLEDMEDLKADLERGFAAMAG
ncbi:cystathionine beta-lyase [Fulvimarina sp. 2208YS6-2-32]|uniref:Cystathionine beta-lyase n=1 Tax=Fulvimarina uroteuthidis TaxID=3098149 RepID=A0ABU5HYB8_9HYPH|nr:cystathionine beta-lyase [Fulvimarina sp. 2208YS6-2-32]MDY8107800.1 cystathionine beta-lyase [Fulvimarina sp. 2208YS6-2-32]